MSNSAVVETVSDARDIAGFISTLVSTEMIQNEKTMAHVESPKVDGVDG
jgi:hypothetical protein